MERAPFKSRELVDYIFSFPKGVFAGRDPILLPKDQLANGINTTVRGDFVKPRPKYKKIALTYPGYTPDVVQANFEDGRFQGACYYNPDYGLDSLMASISGRTYRIEISGDTAYVMDKSITTDIDDPTADTVWLWQAEYLVIRTDGTTQPPLFYDGNNDVSTRSLANTFITNNATVVTPFKIPVQGEPVVGNVQISAAFTGNVGDTINIQSVGAFLVTAIPAGDTLTLTNYNASPVGATVDAGFNVTWQAAGKQLPPGRNGAYGMGRVWMALTDGKQFIAGDLVGSSSGTVANNFRDSVINVTENSYLLGGGNFAVPGTFGEIRAFCFSETLDSSLGQGALQVFTPNLVFSCNAPVDRLTWQNLSNPILTESGKGGGAMSQWATVNANSDIISRSKEGIRSWAIGRKEFSTWGNTPISREVEPQLNRDSDSLLRFVSSVVFDNRYLMTTEGVSTDRGVYWKRIVPINFDPNSSLQGKEPSVYDALYWQGLNVFQLVKGDFALTERCFAFTLNNLTDKIELWEILPGSDAEIYDNGTTRVTWSFETFMDFGQKDPRNRERLRLGQAELNVDELKGEVDFQAYYKPDSWPCWVPWCAWTECSRATKSEGEPGFRPNMGLPEPSPVPCDPTNNRPLREGYTFHVKVVITGHCKIKSGRFGANTVPQPNWAPPVCQAICET